MAGSVLKSSAAEMGATGGLGTARHTVALVMVVAALVAISLLHVQIAVVTLLGLTLGGSLVLARRSLTAFAILVSPFGALVWLTYAMTWRYPLFGFIKPLSGDAALSPMQSSLIAGVLVLLTLPYLTGRLERLSLATSVGAAVLTLLLMGFFGRVLFTTGFSRMEPVPVQRNALNLMARFTGQGLVSFGATVPYRAEVALSRCRPSVVSQK